MRKLMLVRHAKAAWHNPKMSDFDRPLNERGLQNAPEIAKRLALKSVVPQYLLSSPALRAKTTANLFAVELKLAEPAYNISIYEAGFNTLLGVVNSLPDKYSFAAVFGHNPGISELLTRLSGQTYDMPTCAVAVIDFNADTWAMISGGTGNIAYYDYPEID